MMKLWWRDNEDFATRTVTARTILDREEHSTLPDAPPLIPLPPSREALAAMLVCTDEPWVIHNGSRLAPGLHLLSHTDRIDYANESYWISTSSVLRFEVYDPNTHGDDVFCLITKARLLPGEDEIVVCPGQPDRQCGIISRRVAWETTVDSNPGYRCPQCGFDPRSSEWRPSVSRRRSTQHMIEFARKQAGQEK